MARPGLPAQDEENDMTGSSLVRSSVALALAAWMVAAASAQEAGLPVIDAPDKAKAAQAAAAEKLGKPVEWTNSIGMKFRLIPAGEFVMGSKEGHADETPHKVRITRPFYLAVTEVTRAKWEQVTEKQQSTYFPGPDLPINSVSWYHAQDFFARLNKLESAKYRLPTEAEWEYAARAGSATKYPTGDAEADLDKVGWYEKNSDNTLRPVGQKAPNAFGLYDMNGNAWEWCDDFYDAEYYGVSPVDDPKGPSRSVYRYRCLRGGSALFGAAAARSTARNYYQESRYERHIGFRVLLPVTSDAPAKPAAK
jgi:formylglycine-generating enzyme required for sulfatase activity